jgi:hypothetical protein
MKAYLLFNKDTPNERVANDLTAKLKEADVDAEVLDADSPRGIQLVENYDIMQRPALALMKEDGTPVQIWQGEEGLPTVTDVSYLAHQ